RDIVGIAGIILADRPLAPRADRLGAGDDPGKRRAQSLVEPFPESARVGLGGRSGFGLGGGATDRGRGAAEAGEAAEAIDQGHARKPVAPAAAAAKLGLLILEPALLGERGEDWECPFLILDQAEQRGELRPDQLR